MSSAWLSLHWSEIQAAAGHATHATGALVSANLRFLTSTEAVQVDAIAEQIIPGGATPGARDAHVVHFIDYALTSLFAGMAPGFRAQLAEFGRSFDAGNPDSHGFAAASTEAQRAYMKSAQHTAFFGQIRFLTVLGFLSSPKYGGNANGLGWKAIGFEDHAVFTPPFGYYDRQYKGFVPYAPKKPA